MNEEQLRQAIGAMEFYKAQLENLLEQQQLVRYSLEENLRAIGTLKEIKTAGKGSEILVPVGGGSFIYAEVSSDEKILIGIGSGISIEKSIDDAIQTLESRVKELQESLEKLEEQRSRIEEEHARLARTVQEAYLKSKESEG